MIIYYALIKYQYLLKLLKTSIFGQIYYKKHGLRLMDLLKK
jgi:hypothetical protein